MIDSPEMRARVVFRKQLSDSNYGTESAEVAIDVPLDEVYELSSVAATLATARQLVHDELAKSPSPSVVRALEYSTTTTPRAHHAPPPADDPPKVDDPHGLPF